MNRYFVLAYKRSEGRLVEVPYETDTLAEASAQRERWERKYATPNGDVEIPLLVASNLEVLKKTHGRYFKTLRELTATG